MVNEIKKTIADAQKMYSGLDNLKVQELTYRELFDLAVKKTQAAFDAEVYMPGSGIFANWSSLRSKYAGGVVSITPYMIYNDTVFIITDADKYGKIDLTRTLNDLFIELMKCGRIFKGAYPVKGATIVESGEYILQQFYHNAKHYIGPASEELLKFVVCEHSEFLKMNREFTASVTNWSVINRMLMDPIMACTAVEKYLSSDGRDTDHVKTAIREFYTSPDSIGVVLSRKEAFGREHKYVYLDLRTEEDIYRVKNLLESRLLKNSKITFASGENIKIRSIESYMEEIDPG